VAVVVLQANEALRTQASDVLVNAEAPERFRKLVESDASVEERVAEFVKTADDNGPATFDESEEEEDVVEDDVDDEE
jgi:hypothetical protein